MEMKTGAAIMVAMAVPCAFAALQPVVDTDEVFPAAYTADYKLDGNLDKPVWKAAKASLPYRRCAPSRV